jgi:hypothetical protein
MDVATALFSLRTTLRVDERYAPDTTPATYRTVSSRARVIQNFILAKRNYFV